MASSPSSSATTRSPLRYSPLRWSTTYHDVQSLSAIIIIGLAGIDTRALTALIRSKGMPNAVIAHSQSGKFDLHALKEEARKWPGLQFPWRSVAPP